MGLGCLDSGDIIRLFKKGRLDVVNLRRQACDVIPDCRRNEFDRFQMLLQLDGRRFGLRDVGADLADVALDAGQLGGHLLGVAVEADQKLAQISIDVVDVVAQADEVGLDGAHITFHRFKLSAAGTEAVHGVAHVGVQGVKGYVHGHQVLLHVLDLDHGNADVLSHVRYVGGEICDVVLHGGDKDVEPGGFRLDRGDLELQGVHLRFDGHTLLTHLLHIDLKDTYRLDLIGESVF